MVQSGMSMPGRSVTRTGMVSRTKTLRLIDSGVRLDPDRRNCPPPRFWTLPATLPSASMRLIPRESTWSSQMPRSMVSRDWHPSASRLVSWMSSPSRKVVSSTVVMSGATVPVPPLMQRSSRNSSWPPTLNLSTSPMRVIVPSKAYPRPVPVTSTRTPPMTAPWKAVSPPYPLGLITAAEPLTDRFSNPPWSRKARQTVSVSAITDWTSNSAERLLVHNTFPKGVFSTPRKLK